MGAPVAVHYGPEWTTLYKNTIARMKEVFRTSGDVFLLVSSGSGGLEAAISSLLAPGERVLVAVNGFFGEKVWRKIYLDWKSNILIVFQKLPKNNFR